VDRFAKGSVALGNSGVVGSSGHAISVETRDMGTIPGASGAKARAEAYLKSRGIGIK
jgi:hypothetical protein